MFVEGLNNYVIVPVRVASDEPAHIVGGIQFQQCPFVLPLKEIPSQQGQGIAKTLLAANDNTVRLGSDLWVSN